MKTTINQAGVLVTPTMRKYEGIIKAGKISESELISLNSFYNTSSDNKAFFDDIFYNQLDESELLLSDEQNKKGYDFLMGLRFTPSGKERTNSPFGYREENILDNFSHFTFCGFYDAGNYSHSYYIRMYNCYSKDGNSFQYYYNGKMNIIG